MNFIEQCLAGEVFADQIDEFIDRWHDGVAGINQELHEYLGMSWEEYSLWGTRPSIFSSILSGRKKSISLDDELKYEQLSLAARAGSTAEAKEMEDWLKRIGKI